MAPSIRVDGTIQSPPRTLVEVHDLIHTNGPLTEDSVLRTLHARFFQKQYFVSILMATHRESTCLKLQPTTSVLGVSVAELVPVVAAAAAAGAEINAPVFSDEHWTSASGRKSLQRAEERPHSDLYRKCQQPGVNESCPRSSKTAR